MCGSVCSLLTMQLIFFLEQMLTVDRQCCSYKQWLAHSVSGLVG